MVKSSRTKKLSSRGREHRAGRALLFGRVTYEMMEAAWRRINVGATRV